MRVDENTCSLSESFSEQLKRAFTEQIFDDNENTQTHIHPTFGICELEQRDDRRAWLEFLFNIKVDEMGATYGDEDDD